MQIEFAGAAQEVTGSCHILRVGTRTVLLDCGRFQGKRRESREKNAKLPLPIDEIDAMANLFERNGSRWNLSGDGTCRRLR